MSSVNKSEFQFEQLFGSKTRARLLALFLLNPEDRFFVRELTRKIEAQLNSVRREIKNLIDIGLIVEKQDTDEKKKFYQANQQCILFENLRSLFQKVHILLKQNLVQEITSTGLVDYFAFTGCFVDRSSSPTDIVIVGKMDEQTLGKLISGFEKELGCEVNYTIMTREEFLYRRDVKDKFLVSILDGNKIEMVNELSV